MIRLSPSEKDCKKSTFTVTHISDDIGFEAISWNSFWNTGIPSLINLMIAPFGLAIVSETDGKGSIIAIYPARTRYRGVDEDSLTRIYQRIGKYMKHNANALYDDMEIDINTDENHSYSINNISTSNSSVDIGMDVID